MVMGARSGGGRPRAPRALLESLGLATYTWTAAADAFAWGPGIETALGPGAALLATDRAFREACGGGPVFPDGRDHGAGVPYRLHRTLRAPDGRTLDLEDAGRWFAATDGRPAFARGTLRRMHGPGADAGRRLAAALRADVTDALAAGRPLTLLILAPDAEDAGPALRRALRSLMRGRDRLEACADGRWAVLLNACGPEQAAAAADRLAAVVEGAGLRARVGGACVPAHALDAATLVRLAEEALEDAGSRPCIHRAAAARVRHLGNAAPDLALLDALNGRRITLVAEPMIETGSGSPALSAARPALVMAGGGVRMLAPVPSPELAPLLDARLLEIAVDHLAAVPDARLCLPVSAAALASVEWLPSLAAHLGARRGVADRLVLAVEEAALAADLTAAQAVLSAMKALGLGIALDGYGAGHLDAEQLAALPLDLLRLEGALVEGVARSPDDRLHLRALVGLGHHLGLPVAAPWVEETEAARALAGLGCDLLQGGACGPLVALAVPERRLGVGRATVAA